MKSDSSFIDVSVDRTFISSLKEIEIRYTVLPKPFRIR